VKFLEVSTTIVLGVLIGVFIQSFSDTKPMATQVSFHTQDAVLIDVSLLLNVDKNTVVDMSTVRFITQRIVSGYPACSFEQMETELKELLSQQTNINKVVQIKRQYESFDINSCGEGQDTQPIFPG